ncbi:MAG: hypothetical protein D3917_05185 [Candidatus Electrothrix sp. AX5]|nr:hypothetical protein [Candidatus Electrothrix sp. AX5]
MAGIARGERGKGFGSFLMKKNVSHGEELSFFTISAFCTTANHQDHGIGGKPSGAKACDQCNFTRLAISPNPSYIFLLL